MTESAIKVIERVVRRNLVQMGINPDRVGFSAALPRRKKSINFTISGQREDYYYLTLTFIAQQLGLKLTYRYTAYRPQGVFVTGTLRLSQAKFVFTAKRPITTEDSE